MSNDKPSKLRHVFGVRSTQFYAALEGQPIRVVFLDSKVLTGVLVGLDQYDLILDREGVHVLVPKHAIKYVSPATVSGQE